MIKKIWCASLLLLLSAPAISADTTAVDLARLENYLNDIKTISAQFNQVAADGSVSTGKFYLKRPGKMRWDYDAPTPVLIVANGKELVFFDRELEQVTYIPIGSTLASFLAKSDISFSDPAIHIDKIENKSGAIRLTIVQADKSDEGKLTLEFSDTPLQLRNIIILDSQGQTTTLALQDARFDLPLENKLFVFKDPRKKQF